MSKILIPKAEAREIIYGDSEEYDVIEDEAIDNTRWSIVHSVVVKRRSDGKFFRASYSVGATEIQDERPFEYEENATFFEVVPSQVIKTVYKSV